MRNNALLIRHAFARHLLRWRRLAINRRICGSGATTAMAFFDEPIGSACEMPQGGYRKPPARLVVMTLLSSRACFAFVLQRLRAKPIPLVGRCLGAAVA